jgi:hypothetical protein
VYLLSYFGLVWFLTSRNRTKPHPSRLPLIVFTCWLTLLLAHPGINTAASAVSQVFLYMAVFVPVFWAPVLVTHPAQLRRLILLLLACNAVNCAAGLLQIYDPDRWLPEELTAKYQASLYGLVPYTYKGADGRELIRPPGLFDTPGAVCLPGAFAFLCGLAVFTRRNRGGWVRVVGGMCGFLGIAIIWFTHVRQAMLCALGSVVVQAVLMMVRRRVGEGATFALSAAVAFLSSMAVAFAVGGENTLDRFATLLDDQPIDLYYQSRGNMVMEGFANATTIYPLGAGPGRWGTMFSYFGNPSDPINPGLWAEISVPGLLLDGGLIALALYGWAVGVSVYTLWQTCQLPAADLHLTDIGVVFASSLGVIVLAFGFCPFTSQSGVQFWFLIGATHGVFGRYLR